MKRGSMEISVNGKIESIDGSCPVSELVMAKGLADSHLVIMINGEIIQKTEWNNRFIADNDKIEILKFVGGG
jgi:sulfur carrier protein